jgi:sensor histidine kinase YesM
MMVVNKAIRTFNNMSMLKKLIFTYLFVAVIPITIVCYLLMSNTIKTVLEQTSHIDEITQSQLKANLQNELRRLIDISDSLLYEDNIRGYLHKEYAYGEDNAIKLNDYKRIYDICVNRVVLPNNGQINVYFYTTNNNIAYNSRIIGFADDEIIKEQWYQHIINAKGENVIRETYLTENRIPAFSIGRALGSAYKNKYVNVMTVEISESILYKFIAQQGSGNKIYLVDKANNIITTTEREYVGKKVSEVEGLQEVMEDKFTWSWSNIRRSEQVASVQTINDRGAVNGWKVVVITSSSKLVKNINDIAIKGILVTVIIILIASSLIFLFSNQITRRLESLVRNMSEIREGQFGIFVDVDSKDEVGNLAKSFKSMITRIDNLISEVYTAEMKASNLALEKKTAEIHALQSQINPHFLFNTMETIRMNLLIKKEFEIAKIVESYANLFRESCDWREDEILICQELEFVKYYLNIQAFRHKDKFTYSFDIDEELKDALILKFTLQPIVENAVYHGIEMKEGVGSLKISIKRVDSTVRVIVEDDGVGMTEEELNNLKERLTLSDANGKRGVGVRNVDQRLKLFYGDEYGVNIESRKNIGTRVKLTLPVKFGGGKKNV